MHAIGAEAFQPPPPLTVAERGDESAQWLMDNKWLPFHLEKPFERALRGSSWRRSAPLTNAPATSANCGCTATATRATFCGATIRRISSISTTASPGPAIQDLWMLVSGDRHEREQQLGWLLTEYRQFQDFDARELHLIEPLRTLRMIYYQAWLARRWDDPAFPAAFPWFGEDRHWETVIEQLKEQLGEMAEPPLRLPESLM
jgi:hypothetical protein